MPSNPTTLLSSAYSHICLNQSAMKLTPHNSVHGFSLDLLKTEIRGLTLCRQWVLLLKGGKCRERPTYLYGKYGKAFLMTTHLVSTILWETFLTPIVYKQLIYTSDGQQVSMYFLVTLQFLRCELSIQTHGARSLIPNDTPREREKEAGGISGHTSVHWIDCNEPALPLLQI